MLLNLPVSKTFPNSERSTSALAQQPRQVGMLFKHCSYSPGRTIPGQSPLTPCHWGLRGHTLQPSAFPRHCHFNKELRQVNAAGLGRGWILLPHLEELQALPVLQEYQVSNPDHMCHCRCGREIKQAGRNKVLHV